VAVLTGLNSTITYTRKYIPYNKRCGGLREYALYGFGYQF
jgi:hypothetical protein